MGNGTRELHRRALITNRSRVRHGPHGVVNLDGREAEAPRVLFVAEAFGGGMFEITRMQAEGLARLGFGVGIAYGQRPETPGDIRASVDESDELIPLPWTDRSISTQIRAQRSLRRLVRDWRPDLLHLMSSFAGLHGVFAANGTPTVYTPQAYAFTMMCERAAKRWIYLITESFVAGSVDLIGACSLSEGEQARSLPGSTAVAVVPNGIDELSRHRLRSRASASREDLTVVAMGRPLPQRQPEACARILSAVGEHGQVRWLGGGWDDTPGARALIGAGIPVTGWMRREMALKALSESTIYLHWTAWDGLSLSLLEAMALDVIVVASDIGPNREVLGPDQVCPSEQEATNLIRALLDDAELRERFLENQRDRRRWYGADAMVHRWANIYESLLGRQACACALARAEQRDHEGGAHRWCPLPSCA